MVNKNLIENNMNVGIKEIAIEARKKFPDERTEIEVLAIKKHYHCYFCYAWKRDKNEPCALVEKQILHAVNK